MPDPPPVMMETHMRRRTQKPPMERTIGGAGANANEAAQRQSEPPHAKALVAPAAARFQAVLVDQLDRRAPCKRRPLEIQRAPVAILAIEILLPVRKGCGDQPGRAGAAEILHRALDIGKGEMHQAVAAQDSVATRQHILRDVGETIVAVDVAPRNSLAQRAD